MLRKKNTRIGDSKKVEKYTKMKCVCEKREHVKYRKEVKFSERRRRKALRMSGPSRSQVQPKRQSANALGSPVFSLLRNLFEWIQARLLPSKQSIAGRTAQLKTAVRVRRASSGCVRQMRVRRARMSRGAAVIAPEGRLHRSDRDRRLCVCSVRATVQEARSAIACVCEEKDCHRPWPT
jgi:hypothetical protein